MSGTELRQCCTVTFTCTKMAFLFNAGARLSEYLSIALTDQQSKREIACSRQPSSDELILYAVLAEGVPLWNRRVMCVSSESPSRFITISQPSLR